MPDSNADPKINPARVVLDLQRSPQAQAQLAVRSGLSDSLALLRAWQAARLSQTYADLLADPRFTAAGQFFLSDIYAPRDFSQRDQNGEQLHALLTQFVPASMLELLRKTLALNSLTGGLDNALVEALQALGGDLHALTFELYAEGYRRCDNFIARVEQIELIDWVIRRVAHTAGHRLVKPTLLLARLPAEHKGWGDLHDFLWRGYLAFKELRDVDVFASTIRTREMQILKDIYA